MERINHRPRWKHCLEALSVDGIANMARRLELGEAVGIDAVIGAWQRRLQEGEPGWSRLERQAMDVLTWHVGDQPLPDREVGRAASLVRLSPARLRIGLSLLAGRGLVFRLRLPGGELVYWCPREVREAYLAGRVTPCPLPTTDAAGENRLVGVWDTLFYFLVLIEREGLALTKEKRIPQHIRRKWSAELELDSDGLQGTDWENGNEEAAFALLLHLARRLDLIQLEERSVKLQRPAVSHWLLLSWSERLDMLFHAVEDLFLFSRPQHHPLWWWLKKQNHTGWHHWEETVSAAWRDLAAEGDGISRGEVAETLQQWMSPLTWMSWMEWIENKGNPLWRWSPWVSMLKRGEGGVKGRVQPDGEVLLPPGTPLAERWRLAQFADYMGGEQLSHYLLSPDAVKRGARMGLELEEMERVLQELTGRPLPATVTESIREWAKPQGARLESVWLAELDEDDLAGEWLQCFSERPDWGRRVGERSFALTEAGVDAFQRWLEERGVSLTPGQTDKKAWWRQLKEERERYQPEKGEPLGSWRVEQPDSHPEAAIPGWSSLPRMWTLSLRPYHESTLREVFRQAAQLELDVSWSDSKGSIRRITPSSITAEGREWIVRGRGENGTKLSIRLSEVSKVGIFPPWREKEDHPGPNSHV